MAAELKKKADGREPFLSIQQILENVKNEYSQAPSAASVYRDIREG